MVRLIAPEGVSHVVGFSREHFVRDRLVEAPEEHAPCLLRAGFRKA
jgi:hypothetical protein